MRKTLTLDLFTKMPRTPINSLSLFWHQSNKTHKANKKTVDSIDLCLVIIHQIYPCSLAQARVMQNEYGWVKQVTGNFILYVKI